MTLSLAPVASGRWAGALSRTLRLPLVARGKWVLALVAALVLPLALGNPYLIHTVALFLMYTILAMGLSVVVAYAGLLDLGYVAFFAVGAYFYAVLNTTHALPFIAAVPLAALVASGAGVLLGFPTLRVRGDYLALVTLAFGEMVRQVLQNWVVVTGGPKGIPAVAGPHIVGLKLTAPWQYYFVVLGCSVVAIFVLMQLSRSPVARVWEAIREEEVAAKACGIWSTGWLLLAFAIGAAFAGVVGVLFAAVQRFVSPETFVLDESVLVLAIVVLSGGKSLPRLFIATAILYGLPEVLRPMHEYRTLVFGLLLVVFTIADYLVRAKRRDTVRRGTSARANQTATGRVAANPEGHAAREPVAGLQMEEGRPAISRLTLHDVVKSYSGLRALDLGAAAIDLDCTGRIIALLGPNGAGKTTLFDCISGLIRPDRGQITLVPIGSLGKRAPHWVARAGVGRTFQRGRLFGTMTVRENVEVGAYCGLRIPILRSLVPGTSLRRFRETCAARVERALAETGIQAYGNVGVADLPIGIRRKVEIARVLASQPRVLLLDEAVSGLNDAEKAELVPLLERLAHVQGVPIILVEHDVGFVVRIADHVVVLDAGKMIASGEPSEVLRDPRVIESYLGSRGGLLAVGA